MERMIDVRGLKKSYGNIEAVKGLNFYMEKGKLFAFLGPNGAGKSTTIDMITTFLAPDEGTVYINGYELNKDDEQIRNSIGAVFQDSLLDKTLTIEENLMTRGSLYHLKGKKLKQAVEHALNITELQTIADRTYGTLSGGQRRRADIARVLVHMPKILFLDEPTTGLDPKTRAMLWNVILKLQQDNGMTIFLTTHYMEEAAKADYVVIINSGEICAQGTPVQLKEKYAHDILKLHATDKENLIVVLKKHHIDFMENKDRLEIILSSTMDAVPIINLCEKQLQSFEVIHGTLDDAFLGIIEKEINT